MTINKSYPCDTRNYRKGRRDSIKYIVIHYVGATGSALNNVKYYGSSNVGASAHYYVGHASENGGVYQSVDPADCAWHCGSDPGGKYYHECRNDSAIGIEMCCHKDNNGTWFFDDITVDKTVELTRWLMGEYNIPPERVIRHYDVTHKTCPAPFVLNAGAWENFKKRLVRGDDLTVSQYEELKADIAWIFEKCLPERDARLDRLEEVSHSEPVKMIYNYVDGNMPEWARDTVQKLVDKGILKGNENGELGLDDGMIRMLVMLDRGGCFE